MYNICVYGSKQIVLNKWIVGERNALYNRHTWYSLINGYIECY